MHQRWTESIFKNLIEQNISLTTILQWSSSVERADDYAAVLYHAKNNNITITDDFLCNCTQPGTFGKHCEYVLLGSIESFGDSIIAQFAQKKADPWGTQEYGDILCYETLSCEFGLLCLDWRNICDGEQQCLDGLDEENCDKLEFNECEDNEYRCINGMCIAEEYWLDGEIDCMDGSDESLFLLNYHHQCFYKPYSFGCDDRLCLFGGWSCGDGQCIASWNRFGYQLFLSADEYCESRRELNHMCEANSRWRLWTLPNSGLCTNKVGYNDPFLSMQQTNSSDYDRCIYLIRCALSQGFERDCVCDHTNCSILMNIWCTPNQMYPYPSISLVRPYMYSLYDINRSWFDRSPDQFLFSGGIKCRGYYGYINIWESKGLNLDLNWIMVPELALDRIFCDKVKLRYELGVEFDKSCWNNSYTFNGRPYAVDPEMCPKSRECKSQYRYLDGIEDCGDDSDEIRSNISRNLCNNVQKHRLRCSADEEACLPVGKIGFLNSICSNRFDQFAYGNGQSLFHIICSYRHDNNCQFMRDYIGNLSQLNPIVHNNQRKSIWSRIPFRAYCDSFWTLNSHIDEQPMFCRHWTCRSNQYQCQTGQCIELDWVCDGEWDCSDASDEEALILIKNWTPHNRQLNGLSNRIELCTQRYANQAFSNICNVSYEFPCFRANVTYPLNVTFNRPCIPLTHLGNGYEDCYGGFDERNTFSDCDNRMLGLMIRTKDNQCLPSYFDCKKGSVYLEDELLCFYRSKNISCSQSYDVICLDGSCKEDARCNGIRECYYGEDEYRCTSRLRQPIEITYRYAKEVSLQTNHRTTNSQQSSDIHTAMSNEYSYICNRGIAVSDDREETHCFCPPSYYGRKCQYYSDRLTIISHLDMKTLSKDMDYPYFKVIVTFRFENNIVDYHQYVINSTYERLNYTKQKFLFVYSRSELSLEHKQLRYFNRDNIIEEHPYSVNFELFGLTMNKTKDFGGMWHYPIYFDYLPSFRLTAILKFPDWYNNTNVDSCQTNIQCNSNSTCRYLFNGNKTFCECKPGFYGDNCEFEETQCSSYCSLDSICKVHYRGILTNIDHPLCICPLGRFGPRCYLQHDECDPNPCLNNGSCHLTYDPYGQQPFICQCDKHFNGKLCQNENPITRIDVNMNDSLSLVSVVQFCDVIARSFEILVRHQQLIQGKIRTINYNNDQIFMPPLGILKKYDKESEPNYFLLYTNELMKNTTITPKQCANIEKFLFQNDHPEIPFIFKYHSICAKNTEVDCFYDLDYLCICQLARKRAECYGYDPMIDQCKYCLSGGRCVRGNLRDQTDFICLCPICHQGHRCEFNLEPFGSTIDSLLSSDSFTIRIVYVITVVLIFIIGFFNNSCAFLTFKRPEPRKIAVGNYLLIVICVNQFALLWLLFKFIYVLLESSGYFINSDMDTINRVTCKGLSYLVSLCTRSTYWLTSWITINRVCLIIFPKFSIFYKPLTAIVISVATILILGGMHIHEIVYYTIIKYTKSTLCVTHFDQSIVSNYNRMTTFIHHLVPFIIQMVSITLLIILVTRSKFKTASSTTTLKQILKQQFVSLKELYITSIIIILSALPQTIFSFSLACLSFNHWQRHILLSTYLLSYMPQTLGFLLFVLPSTTYKKEFSKTFIARTLSKSLFYSPVQQTQIKTSNRNKQTHHY